MTAPAWFTSPAKRWEPLIIAGAILAFCIELHQYLR